MRVFMTSRMCCMAINKIEETETHDWRLTAKRNNEKIDTEMYKRINDKGLYPKNLPDSCHCD